VGDNNMRTYVKATDKKLRESPNSGDFFVKAATPGVNSIESFESLEEGQGQFSIDGNTEQIEKVFGVNQLELIEGFSDDASKENFHDITANADSLLANVTSGGLRKDLSLYFDADEPAMGGEWSGYIRQGNAPRGPYGQLALSEHDEFDTGAWSMLRQHAKLHRAGSKIRRSSGAGNTFLLPNSTDDSDYNDDDYPGWNQQKRVLAPIILRGAMILSVGADDLNGQTEGLTALDRNGNTINTVRANLNMGILPRPNNGITPTFSQNTMRYTQNNYLLNFGALPLVTLWNPYNVALRIPDGFLVKIEGTGTTLDVDVNGSSLSFQWAATSADGLERRTPARGIFFNGNNFEIPPGATATFGPDLSRNPAPSRASQYFEAIHLESPSDFDQMLSARPPFNGGFTYNSLLNSGRSADDGYAAGGGEDFAPFGRLSGFFADASDTLLIRVNEDSPFGEEKENQSSDPNAYEGLANYEIFSGLGFALAGGEVVGGDYNNFYNRDPDSAKILSKVNWRADTGNPVTTASSGLGGAIDIPMSRLTTGERYFFASVDLRLKSLDSSGLDQDANPNATWLHSIPSHSYNGLTHLGTALDLGEGVTSPTAIATDAASRAYTMNFAQLDGDILSFSNTQYQLDLVDDEGLVFFFGKSYQEGQSRAIAAEIPLAPLQSIAQFMHSPMIPIDSSRWSNLNVQNLAVSNSYANPMVEMDQIIFPLEHPSDPKDKNYDGWKVWMDFEMNKFASNWRGHPDLDGNRWVEVHESTDWEDQFIPIRFTDRSYIANTLLWDDFFLSGIDDYRGRFIRRLSGENGRRTNQVIEDFVTGENDLPNASFRYESRGLEDSSIIEKLENEESNYLHSAEHIVQEGGFNINSLSVKAWRAFLASNLGKSMAATNEDGDPEQEVLDLSTKEEYIISRYTVSTNPGAKDEWQWTQPNKITSADLDDLAEKIVQEVADRGPFRSIGEFVNRRVDSANPDFAVKGALQAALDKSTINADLMSEIVDTSGTEYKFPDAAQVSQHTGSPEYVMQGDLLNSLGPVIQSRSDSFTIRAYGESADGRAKAWCEAQVSRSIDYVDSAGNEPHETITDLNSTNQNFGRQFRLKSLRWLEPSEV